MAEQLIDFGQSSSVKFGLTNLMQKPQVADQTSARVNELLGVAAQTTEDITQRMDVAETASVSREYTEMKRRYSEAKNSALTSEDHKNAYTSFVSETDSLVNREGMREKVKTNFMQIQQKDLDYLSSEYRAVVKAENHAHFKSAIADVAAAGMSLDKEAKAELYNNFLDASKFYQVDRVVASETFAKGLADSYISTFDKDTTSLTTIEAAKKEVMEVLSTDPHNANKTYINEIEQSFNKAKDVVQAIGVKKLGAELAAATSLEQSNRLINNAESNGILDNKDMVDTLRIEAKTKYTEKARTDQKAYLAVLASDMELSQDVYVKKLQESSLSAEDKRTMELSRTIAVKKYNVDIATKNIATLVNNPYASIESTQGALDTAREATTNPTLLANIDAQQAQLNKRMEQEKKVDANLILRDGFTDFGVKMASMASIYGEDSPEFRAGATRLINQEMKKYSESAFKVEKHELDNYLNNDAHTVGEKLVALQNADFLSAEAKGAKQTKLLSGYVKDADKVLTKHSAEVRKIAKDKVQQVKADAAVGIYNTTAAEFTVALGMAYPRGIAVADVADRGFAIRLEKEYEMRHNFTSGISNKANPVYEGINIQPSKQEIKQLEGSLQTATTPEELQKAANIVRHYEDGKFVIPKEITQRATIAEAMLKFSPEVAMDKWKKFINEPADIKKVAEASTYIKNEIIGSSAFIGELPSNHPALSNIDTISEAYLKAGFTKQQTRDILVDGIDREWVNVGGLLSKTNYLPKTQLISSGDDYTRTISLLDKYYKKEGRKDIQSINKIYPSTYTNPEQAVWFIDTTMTDGTTKPIPVTYEFLKNALHK